MTCHSVSKAGGEIGPDLSAIGQTSPPDYIIHSILLPDQSIKEQYHTLVVLTAEGQVYQGIVADKDNRRVVLKESTGALRTVPVDSIEEQKAGGSLMPKGLVNLMTHAEFVDLVRFLSELGKPGPYAIRTTPTIQRWRVLRVGLLGPGRVRPGRRDPARPGAPRRARPLGARSTPRSPASSRSTTRPRSPAGARSFTSRASSMSRRRVAIRISPRFPEGIRFWVDDAARPARNPRIHDVA